MEGKPTDDSAPAATGMPEQQPLMQQPQPGYAPQAAPGQQYAPQQPYA